MDELIILEAQGRASSEELDELRRWREASEENDRRYQEVRALWEVLGLRDEIDSDLAAPSAVELLRSRTAETDTSRSTRPAMHRRWKSWATAAAVLLVAIGGGYFATMGPDTLEVATDEFRTGPNDLTTAVLDDGTVARLGPNTTLQASIGEAVREVRLEGRAFFAAAHDADRPFVVQTADGEARVLGTRFEVQTDSNGTRLLVVDGRVALSAEGGEAELEAGDLGRSVPGQAPSVTRVETPEALLDWMGSWIAFESTPLPRVARELEVRLGIEVEIVDTSLADRTVSGWFSQADRTQMLAMICRVAELTCTTEDGVIRIQE